MTTFLTQQIRTSARRTWLGGVVGSLFAAAAALAQDTNTTELKPAVVTGSYIPTAETVGTAPLETVGAAEIQQSGQSDVLSVLKKLSTSFAGNGNIGQTVNNGGFGEANVALRNLPTLVLVNGQRMANSSFSRGQAVDLNTIPLAMIERIEVLKDGASPIYGSDAIGGVVNIITKKNYSGAEIGGRYGFATEAGKFTEQRASVVAGATTDKTSITAGGEWYHLDPLKTVDRAPANYNNEQLFENNVSDANGSGRFPGRVNTYILAGDGEYLGGNWQPGAAGNPAYGYVPGIVTPPVFPGQTFSSVAAYNAYAQMHPDLWFPGYAQNPASYTGQTPYVHLTTPPAANSPQVAASPNLALFQFNVYTYSIQEQNRDNAFANFRHDLFGDKKAELFANFFYSHTKSEAQLAPSPVGNLFADGKIGVPANNPYNPFGIPLGYGGLTDPANPGYSPANTEPNVRTRFIDFGPRQFVSQKDFVHFDGGIEGDITDKYHYSGLFNFSRSDEEQQTLNAVNSYALNQALTPNPNHPGLSLLRDYRSNQYVPIYNIFGLGGMGLNDPATLDAVRATLYQSGISELYGAEGGITGKPFDLPAGPFQFHAGFNYVNEALQIDFDGLTKQGQVPGLNPAFPTPRSTRDRWAGYLEINVPLTSPQKNIPGLYSFEIDAAGRYETLNPGGDSWVPKVGFRWQPIDNQITVRGSYSQGFVAPSIYSLYGAPLVNNPAVSLPDGTVQEQTATISNPNLPSAKSESYTAGIVISPKALKGLTLSVDWYHILLRNTQYNPDYHVMLDGLQAASADAAAMGNPSLLTGYQWYNYYAKPNGDRLQPGDVITHADFGNLNIPTLAGANEKTDGIDVSLNYLVDTEKFGKFDLWANANVLLNFQFENGPSFPYGGGEQLQYISYRGQFTDPNYIGQGFGTLPEWQISTGVTWNYMNWTYAISARYIPPVNDLGDNHPFEGGDPNGTGNAATIDGTSFKVKDWYTIDMQLSYEFKNPGKWYDRTKLTVGCNNVTDNLAPLIAASTEDHSDKSTYDIVGRFLYFEVSKKF